MELFWLVQAISCLVYLVFAYSDLLQLVLGGSTFYKKVKARKKMKARKARKKMRASKAP